MDGVIKKQKRKLKIIMFWSGATSFKFSILHFKAMVFLIFKIHIGLNIALVPANMARISFGPCKKKILFLVPAKFFVF